MIKMIWKLFTHSKDMTRSERGATYVYVAILLPAFIGFIGLGVDVGLWQVTKRDTQIIADASAVAGALEVMRFQADPIGADTNQAALTAATANGYDAAGGLDTIQINDPPVTGPYTGVDSTVEVIMTRSAPIFFSSLFRTTPVLVRSRAVAASGTGDGCIWALNPGDQGNPEWGVNVRGNALVDLECGVRVFSSSTSPDSLTCGGGAILDANGHDIMVAGTADDCLSPAAVTAPALSDPLGGMLEPEWDSSFCDTLGYTLVDEMVWIPSVDEFGNPILDAFGKPILIEVLNPVLTEAGLDANADGILDNPFTPVNYPKYATRVFEPGCFSGKITVSNTDLVTFEPGLYIMDGAPLTINGSANVFGAGVMFYLNPNKTPDRVTINGGATVSLSAPTASCDDIAWEDCSYYESMLFMEARDVAIKGGDILHKFAGGAEMDLNGILYFPSTDVQFSGGNTADNSSISIIAYTIDFVGTTDIGDFPVVINGEGQEEVVLPFNRFLVKVQLLE